MSADPIKKFLKSWMLVIAMVIGISSYLVYHSIPEIHCAVVTGKLGGNVAGGFYSIWHNCYNTWQLRRREKES